MIEILMLFPWFLIVSSVALYVFLLVRLAQGKIFISVTLWYWDFLHKNIYRVSGCSGDGILFEIINGVFERPDWEKVFSEISFGVIPCGSGNGLAKAIAHSLR